MWLSGGGRDVFEIGVVVKDYRTVVFGNGRGQQIDDTGSAVVAAGRHPKLDIAGSIGNRLGDRQHDIEAAAALADRPDVGQISSGIAGLEVHGHTCGRGAINDQAGDDIADRLMANPGMR